MPSTYRRFSIQRITVKTLAFLGSISGAGLPVVQRPHHPDPGKHRRAASLRNQHQGPSCGLPAALVLRYTSIGLAIHAAGAEPKAVDKSGLSVTRIRYGCVLFAGFMASLAGAFLSIGDIHTFTEGMTRGAGYLAIASVIFGKWRIGGTTLACLLFGAATALQFQLPALGIIVPNALLIMLPYPLALLAVGGLVGRQMAPATLGEPYRR